jgi:hypothetical protein
MHLAVILDKPQLAELVHKKLTRERKALRIVQNADGAPSLTAVR